MQPFGFPASIAGLLEGRAMVGVGPPLYCRSSSIGSVLFKSPALLKLQLLSLLRL